MIRPTPAELEILNVLWRIGPATVRTVHAELEPNKPTGYTTILKLMQIMAEKGLLVRNESERAHVYSPALEREHTERQIVHEMLDRVFGGSATQLVLRALSERRASKEEITEIREMLDRMERENRS